MLNILWKLYEYKKQESSENAACAKETKVRYRMSYVLMKSQSVSTQV